MNRNINRKSLNYDTSAETYKDGLERKKYKSPSLTNIGRINQMTLAGGIVPSTDSGNGFSPS